QDPEAGGPYLLDLSIDMPITTLLSLDAAGRPRRIESWTAGTSAAGPGRGGILLEAWELVSDEQAPADRIPVGTFDLAPPKTLLFQDEATPSPLSERATVTITDALQLVRSPLYVLPPGPEIDAPAVEAAHPANRPLDISDSNAFDAALDR